MKKFIYKSNLRRERMPGWLKDITDYTLKEFNSFFLSVQNSTLRCWNGV